MADKKQPEGRREDLEALAEAIEKGEMTERALVRRTSELRERNRELQQTNDEIIEMLGNVVEMRNQESGQHIQRVKAFTRVLARRVQERLPEYGLTDDDVDLITSASALHDVGKIMIPDAILLKPGRLDANEFEIMKTHSARGCEVLRQAPKSWSARYRVIGLEICRHHHEKWDGKGYPDGLKGDEIPISAQIVSVADCFDALTQERVYKPAFSVDKAYSMILGGECGAFSPRLMDCFRDCRELFAELAAHPERADVVISTSVYGNDKLRGLRVLLVDDSELTRAINREVLEHESAIVTEAASGQEALDRIAAGMEADVVLMDIVMPGMDGIAATRALRNMEKARGRRLTIISLTSEGTSDQVDACLKAGADDCMNKPLMVSELSQILVALRKRSEQEGKKLEDTLRNTSMDPLTHVKNMVAYTDMVAELTGRMADSVPPEYAVLICDMEQTREINGQYGLEMGDRYLLNGCRLLVEVFEHSPVFRVGGDKFLVVLQGREYGSRDLLFGVLMDKRRQAAEMKDIPSGYVSFAAGMAAFDPEQDGMVSDVVRRASAAMDAMRRRS